MGILRADRITGLGGANAITGSTYFVAGSGTSHGQYLRVEDLDGDFKFGTSDFTIEFWMNTPTVDTSDIGAESSLASMLDHGYGFSENASGAWWVLHHKDATLIWGFNGSNQLTTSSFIKVNTWHHIAVVRTGGNTKIYADGTQVGTVSDGQNYTDALARPLDIGAQTYQTTYRNYEGFISNLRIINGTALYTSAFTPPTTRLTKTSDTVLLTCNSISDILHEETGKIITPNRNTISSSYATARRDTPNTPVGFSTTTDVGSQYGSTFDGFGSFATSTYMVPPGGNTRERNRGRGIISRGMTPDSSSLTKIMQYIEMSSGGNSIDFGEGMDASYGSTAVSSSTRGVTQPGATANSSPYSIINRLDFVTIANTANAIDFGDLLVKSMHKTGLSNQTRGIFAAGFSNTTQAMDKIEIATLGDATDFGDSIGASYGNNQGGQAGSTTRGLIAGGSSNSAPAEVEKIQFVTFSTLGDAQDFGDLVNQNGYFNAGASSQTRAVFAGGIDLDSPYASQEVIQYVTIATTGNAIDFGDLTVTRYNGMGMSNGIRGYFAGGISIPGPTRLNVIDFVTISTTGNSVDSGDLDITSVNSGAGMSDSHGGLS